MDWSKAKNIIIGALIAANIFLGVKYRQNVSAENRALAAEAENTRSYLESVGIDLQCPIPQDRAKLPVVSVMIEDQTGEKDGDAMTKNGLEVVLLGAEGKTVRVTGEGSNSARVITGSDAMRRLVAKLGAKEVSGVEITQARLVYLVDRTGLEDAGGSDTAVPAWEFVTREGPVYIEAFAD